MACERLVVQQSARVACELFGAPAVEQLLQKGEGPADGDGLRVADEAHGAVCMVPCVDPGFDLAFPDEVLVVAQAVGVGLGFAGAGD